MCRGIYKKDCVSCISLLKAFLCALGARLKLDARNRNNLTRRKILVDKGFGIISYCVNKKTFKMKGWEK